MRLFIAIPLPTAVTKQLAALRSRLERTADGLRWSPQESWHITLQFLGSTTEPQYACVVEHMQTLFARSVSIRLGDLGFFDRAGVFFVDVSMTPQLVRLQQAVTHATTDCGFVPEDRPYHPHITLARTKGQSRSGIRDLKRRLEAGAIAASRFPAFTAHEFLLYESFLGPTGSRYEVRARFPLAANKGD